MAQTYTLEEAAQRLDLPVDEFKKKLREEWKSVRSFRDGATLRFRSNDIDELARSLGQASDPGLPLGPGALSLQDSSEEVPLTLAPASKGGPGTNLKPAEEALFLADDSDDIFALPEQGSSVVKKKQKGDSDVRLDLTPSKKDPKVNKEPTEEFSLDLDSPFAEAQAGKSSGRLKPPASAKIPRASETNPDDGSSEFELTLDSDSDSFELTLTTDSSEEVALGGESPRGGAPSGIDLGKPQDSGVSLEKKRKPLPDDSDSDLDFQINSGAPASKPIRPLKIDDGSSEFELTLDDSDGSSQMEALAAAEQAEKDIFETDFELPASSDDDSGSEVLPVDGSDTDLENSDFDLAIADVDIEADDESASQVVLVDDEVDLLADDAVMLDEDETKPKSKVKSKGRPLVDGSDEEEDLATVAGRRRSLADDDVPTRTVAPPPPRWGIVPLLFLLPTFVIAVFGGLMAYEIVRGMAGYQSPSAASPIANGVAETFGLKKK